MRNSAARLAIGVAAAAVLATAGTPDPDRDAPARPDAATLAARLGAARADERDAATAALASLGPGARIALEVAADADDPEVRFRARGLLARLGDDGRRASARRYREAVAAIRADGLCAAALAPGGPTDAALRAFAPESGTALADAARRTARHGLVDVPVAGALARLATPDSFAALAEVWRADRLVPSAGLAAAREIDAATDDDPETAGSVLGAAGRAADILGDPLAAREAPRRRTGVALLAAFRGRAEVGTLLRAAADPDPGVRAEAARTLGRHAPSDGAAALRALAADADPDVRVAALEALAHVSGAPTPGPAVAAAEDAVPAVRRAAARLLARDATPSEIPLLRRLASDPSASVRSVARRTLDALAIPRSE